MSSVVLSIVRQGPVRLGLILGISTAFAAMSGPSFAQVDGKATGAASPAPASDAATIEKGRGVFGDFGCGSCHSLSDAGATGHVGPSLDGDANLSVEFIASRVTNGQGLMPSFGGQLSPEEISSVSAYVAKAAQK